MLKLFIAILQSVISHFDAALMIPKTIKKSMQKNFAYPNYLIDNRLKAKYKVSSFAFLSCGDVGFKNLVDLVPISEAFLVR